MEKKLTIHEIENGYLLTPYSLDGKTKNSSSYRWGEQGQEKEMIERILKILELTKYTLVNRTDWAKEQVKKSLV